MKDTYKKAHALTKKIYDEFGDVDYKFQFQLCLSYLCDEKINSRINEIINTIKITEDEARLIEKVEFYYKKLLNTDENLNLRLWQRKEKRRVYLSSSYISSKTYIDLKTSELFDNKNIIKF